jgi:hypothetical protein
MASVKFWLKILELSLIRERAKKMKSEFQEELNTHKP